MTHYDGIAGEAYQCSGADCAPVDKRYGRSGGGEQRVSYPHGCINPTAKGLDFKNYHVAGTGVAQHALGERREAKVNGAVNRYDDDLRLGTAALGITA